MYTVSTQEQSLICENLYKNLKQLHSPEDLDKKNKANTSLTAILENKSYSSVHYGNKQPDFLHKKSNVTYVLHL